MGQMYGIVIYIRVVLGVNEGKYTIEHLGKTAVGFFVPFPRFFVANEGFVIRDPIVQIYGKTTCGDYWEVVSNPSNKTRQ